MSFVRTWLRLPSSLSLVGVIERLNTQLGPRDLVAPNGLGTPVRTVTAAYAVDGTDCVVLADATGGAFTVTLPRADQAKGRIFRIKRLNGGGNNVTVQGTTGNIDGAGTNVLGAQYASIDLQSDGANWFLL